MNVKEKEILSNRLGNPSLYKRNRRILTVNFKLVPSKGMGFSRVVVSSNKLGEVVEKEGLVTVNYKGGQVNKNQDQVKGLQYEGKL